MSAKSYIAEMAYLFGNHLEGDTRDVFHARNADTIDPGNTAVWANDSYIAII